MSANPENLSASRIRRLRDLCRTLNKKRRRLRDQVDLLCKDLVKGNRELSRTLDQLQKAYSFQSALLGEYDKYCLLYKALRWLREPVPHAGALIYLLEDNDIAAHLFSDCIDIPDIELWQLHLTRYLVREVVTTARPLRVHDINALPDTPPVHDPQLTRTSFTAWPLIHDSRLLGVLILYVDNDAPFPPDFTCHVSPLLAPLARAIDNQHALTTHLSAG